MPMLYVNIEFNNWQYFHLICLVFLLKFAFIEYLY